MYVTYKVACKICVEKVISIVRDKNTLYLNTETETKSISIDDLLFIEL